MRKRITIDVPKKKTSGAIISCSINAARFEAEGDRDEVLAKFKKFVDETFAPLGAALKAAGKDKQ